MEKRGGEERGEKGVRVRKEEGMEKRGGEEQGEKGIRVRKEEGMERRGGVRSERKGEEEMAWQRRGASVAPTLISFPSTSPPLASHLACNNVQSPCSAG